MTLSYKKTIDEFELETLNCQIESFCESNAVPVGKLFSIQLIIEELVTNIIKYGGADGSEAIIEVELIIDADSISLTISDNSASFNPLEQQDVDTGLSLEERSEGGLGLFLVRKKVKSLSYEYKNGFNILKAIINR